MISEEVEGVLTLWASLTKCRKQDDGVAEMKLIFDPDLPEQFASFSDVEYGEMPLPPPPPPPASPSENPYEPNLEDEYY
ncbi:Hypothetical predicted protein [Xyrichtys novacula]|uniref:Uncharacterized protein n=1 Tax=Xyrichtys novacula TaxID=13765 RepID=A0AAV1ELM4_XYRNO|nr:Hypothetical predicted protein [Xyrichtys novacula]